MSAFRNPCFVLLFHVVLLSLLPLRTTCSATTQAEALVQWKNSLSVLPPSLSSWSLSNLNNLCNWTSNTCDAAAAKVTKIDLSDGNLSGSTAQFNFTPFANLTLFNLKNNTIDGPIPTSIGTLANLVFLDLSNNTFQGNMPVEIGCLTELQYLSLSNNNLSGTIPPQVSNFQNLSHFYAEIEKKEDEISLSKYGEISKMLISSPIVKILVPKRSYLKVYLNHIIFTRVGWTS